MGHVPAVPLIELVAVTAGRDGGNFIEGVDLASGDKGTQVLPNRRFS
jgi:hypothetical protein